MKQTEAQAAVWGALGAIARKEGHREKLADGTEYALNLSVVATFGDGKRHRVAERIEATLSVGEPFEKASSSAPRVEAVLAVVLDRLGARVREKLLGELPEEFAKKKGLPEVSPERAEEAKRLLERLRTKELVEQRGPVACRYERR